MTINGLKVYTEGDSNNRPMLFIHGFPYNHKMWDFQAEALKDEYYVIRYDIRGLGKSSVGDGQYTMEMYVDDLFAIMDKLKLENPVVCGLSMGGYILFRAVERDQSKFGSVIFCDTKPFGDDNAGKLKRANSIKQINEEGLKSFTSSFVPNCFWQKTIDKKHDLYKSVLSETNKNSDTGVKGAQIAMISRTDTSGILPALKIPALVICGEHDALTPPAVMSEFSSVMAGAVYRTIPDAGHMAPLENPDAVNLVIRDFLAGKLEQ